MRPTLVLTVVVLRENGSPEKAVQFSNLYARLLAQPVLSKKWEILYLLHQLSSSTGREGAVDLRNGVDEEKLGERPTESRDSAYSGQSGDVDHQMFKDAFATSGLPRLPTERSRAKQSNYNDSLPRKKAQSRPGREEDLSEELDEQTVKVSPAGPSEATLLRELPFTLQGLATTQMPFTSQGSIEIPPTLPLPLVSILYKLAEPSLLYRSLSTFVESKDEGLIGQSLRSAIQNELRSYLGLISALETEIRQAVTSIDGMVDRRAVGKVGVTLKRCVVWTKEATMGLRLMSVMVEEAKTKKGGQLITMVHSFSTSHGDPFVNGFAERMISHVTRPFYDMLRRWIYDGELSDPYHEFFVIEQRSNDLLEDPRKAPATSVWEEKYKLDDSMIPSIVTEEFARKVFLIGKSLNFIRYSCGDSAWVESYSKDASRELKYGDTATLETSIDQAYKTTMARLIHLMDNKFQLFEHLNALKRYLLLGQGDFIALLMESLSTNLDRPAGSQYRHTLTAQLEHAIRGSNAQFDSPDILRRLDARLTEMEKGDTGWDVFTLEYKVDAPVDVIINPWANRQYLKIFNLLWRVKRVEFSLSSTWRRCMTGARGVLATKSPQMRLDWKSARCAIAEMIHFVNQLQYYILFEVIESSWSALHTAITKPDATLDDLISAHTKYLKAITHKGLLGSVRTTSSGHKEDVFTAQLHEILKIILSHKDAVDGLYSYSVAEFTRKQELAAKIETRTAQGKWGLTEKDEEDMASPPVSVPKAAAAAAAAAGLDPSSPFPLSSSSDETALLPNIRARLQSLSADFKNRINVLLGDLAVQPDVDMKFLAVVMNFNDVYQPKKRRRHGAGGGAAAAEKKTPGGSGEGKDAGGRRDGEGVSVTAGANAAGKVDDKERKVAAAVGKDKGKGR